MHARTFFWFLVVAAVAKRLGPVRVDRTRLRGVLRRLRRARVVRSVTIILISDHRQVVIQEELDRALGALVFALELDHDLTLALVAPPP